LGSLVAGDCRGVGPRRNGEAWQPRAGPAARRPGGGGIRGPARGGGRPNVQGGGAGGGGGPGGWTYYETIGGGQGASDGAPGPSGVHVGMSNTRNTPVEVLEMEYPLRVRSYALRRGSGGAGRWTGGEGVIRACVV